MCVRVVCVSVSVLPEFVDGYRFRGELLQSRQTYREEDCFARLCLVLCASLLDTDSKENSTKTETKKTKLLGVNVRV